MQVGMCSGDYTPRTAEAMLAAIHASGSVCAQISLASITECDFTPDRRVEIPERIPREAVKAIREAAERHGVRVISLNGTFNMAHPDRAVRLEGARRFEALCAAAQELGAPFVSLCTGTRNEADLWTGHPANGEPSAMDDLYATTELILRHAERFGVTMGIETEANNLIDSADKARTYMDKFASPRLKMILDAANLFHAGDAHRDNVRPVLDHAFELVGRDVVMTHAKDIREGDGIRFCATGEGIIDFPYFVKLLRDVNYPGDMLIHGVYDEAKMPGRVEYLRGIVG